MRQRGAMEPGWAVGRRGCWEGGSCRCQVKIPVLEEESFLHGKSLQITFGGIPVISFFTLWSGSILADSHKEGWESLQRGVGSASCLSLAAPSHLPRQVSSTPRP